jgi:chromate reductase, NAD(P)H dehydrogenase (quinone)
MITIISGTNRTNSRTKLIASHCFRTLADAGEEVQLLDLVDINLPILSDEMYKTSGQHPYIGTLQDKYLINSDHWLIISPEYNGSFPGILKLFLDAVSVRRYKETFSGKSASMIGVASGRAGNFRGMEHLTGILNYLNIIVMPNKLPISVIDKNILENGSIENATSLVLSSFLEEMVMFYRNQRQEKSVF